MGARAQGTGHKGLVQEGRLASLRSHSPRLDPSHRIQKRLNKVRVVNVVHRVRFRQLERIRPSGSAVLRSE